MTDLCTQCGEHLASPAIFCARCGARVSKFETKPETEPEQLAAEKAPVTGAFSGLYFGLIAMPLMLIVGVMLCRWDCLWLAGDRDGHLRLPWPARSLEWVQARTSIPLPAPRRRIDSPAARFH
jgi:hypothetical protein